MSFLVANSAYVFARVASIALSAVVFLYGLRKLENKLDYVTGNFNVPAVQYTAVSVVSLFQGYLLYVLAAKQIKRARENAAPVVVKTKPKQKSRKREGKEPPTTLNFSLCLSLSSCPCTEKKNKVASRSCKCNVHIYVFGKAGKSPQRIVIGLVYSRN